MERLPPTRTVGEWRRAAREFLKAHRVANAGGEADLLARHVLDLEAVELTLSRDRRLSPAEKRRLSRLVRRRGERVPLQYVLGEVEFFGLLLRVTPSVLIPRPETEGLVDRVLETLEPESSALVADVGTGSGAIACALAVERPGLRIRATDVSPDALRVARGNARRLGVSGAIRFLHGRDVEPLERDGLRGRLQVLMSNPPYISPRERDRLEPEVGVHEPEVALFAGDGGMTIIRRIVAGAGRVLAGNGLLALEIGETQGERVASLLETAGCWESIQIGRDLAGRVRYALARFGGR